MELGGAEDSQSLASQAGTPQGQPQVAASCPTALDFNAEAKVAEFILAYRELGRLLADINPLSPAPNSHPLLELSRFGLSQSDLSKTFTAGRLIGMGQVKFS